MEGDSCNKQYFCCLDGMLVLTIVLSYTDIKVIISMISVLFSLATPTGGKW